MEKIILNDCLKHQILAFLYEDEKMQAVNIEAIERDPYCDVYMDSDNNAVLVLVNEGNTYIAGFAYRNIEHLMMIKEQLSALPYSRVILHGPYDDVALLLKPRESTIQYFYEYHQKLLVVKETVRRATLEDKEVILQLYGAFFNEDVMQIIHDEKIKRDIDLGVYLIEKDRIVIGLARYAAKTPKYCEITTVYIKEAYRNQGYGKQLVSYLVNVAILEHKIPFLMTSIDNKAAQATYESLGFEKTGTYAFEFLSKEK